MSIKGENQIYVDIIGFINSCLSSLAQIYPDLDFNNWKVLQLKQPVKLTEINPTIYITCTNRTRNGWQHRNYPIDENKLYHQEKFKLEVDVQFSALRRRELNDTVQTLNSADILEYLKAYMLNPYSLQDLRNLGYQIYQPSAVQTPDFIDDSDNFEFMPFFTTTFILDQSLISPQTSIDEYTLKIRRI